MKVFQGAKGETRRQRGNGNGHSQGSRKVAERPEMDGMPLGSRWGILGTMLFGLRPGSE